MVKKIFIIPIICLFSLLMNESKAQENHFLLSYSSSQGVNDLKYLNLNGVQLEWQYQFKDSPFSLGLSVGYHASKQNEYIDLPKPVPYGLNTEQMTNVKSIPFLLHTKYTFHKNKYFRPYFGIGAGLYHQSHGLVIQTYDVVGKAMTRTIEDWQFGFAPEVGVNTDLFQSIGIFISLKYNFIHDDIDRLDYNNVSFNIGLIF